jgi:predicted small lipoprotein YifL
MHLSLPRLCIVLLCSFSACGLRGPLYLPEPAKPVETPSSQPNTADPRTDAESSTQAPAETDPESEEEKKSRPAVPSDTPR